MGEPLPAATKTEDLDVVLAAAVGNALDDCIEAGDVAATGENADAPFRHEPCLNRVSRTRPLNAKATDVHGEIPPCPRASPRGDAGGGASGCAQRGSAILAPAGC